jgi:hypothetical protein
MYFGNFTIYARIGMSFFRLPVKFHTNHNAQDNRSVSMSSPTLVAISTDAAVAKPTRPVTQRKRKASAAPEAVPVAVAAVPVADAAAAPKTAKITKKRKASVAAVDAVAVVVAVDAVPAPVKKARGPKPKKAAVADEAAPAAVVAAVAVAVAAEADTDAPKKSRAKPKQVYTEGYGDEDKDESEQLYTLEAWETWKEDTKRRADNQTFPQWKTQKKAYFKKRKLEKAKRKKRATKKVDKINTFENHKRRLLSTFGAADFGVLDGVWLSTHGFDDKLSAAELEAISDKSSIKEGALQAYSVYSAAVANGFKPLGIVSETQKKDSEDGEMKYVSNVDGSRVYVGVALPFRNKLRSVFSVLPEDRVYLAEESDTVEGEADDVAQ